MSNRKIPIINSKGEPVILDDDSGVVPPGYGVRVSSFLMDGDAIQQAIAAENVRVTDAFGAPAGHKPGFCFDANSDGEARARKAFDDHKLWLRDAWRAPQATTVADVKPKPAVSVTDARNQAYEDMVRRTENAWKTNPGALR